MLERVTKQAKAAKEEFAAVVAAMFADSFDLLSSSVCVPVCRLREGKAREGC
jgi:hypothetical protein